MSGRSGRPWMCRGVWGGGGRCVRLLQMLKKWFGLLVSRERREDTCLSLSFEDNAAFATHLFWRRRGC